MRPSTICLALLLAGFALGASGCLAPTDRCWVRPDRHEQARRLYVRSGSLDLTRTTLLEADWLPCEVEETVQRLAKENSL